MIAKSIRSKAADGLALRIEFAGIGTLNAQTRINSGLVSAVGAEPEPTD